MADQLWLMTRIREEEEEERLECVSVLFQCFVKHIMLHLIVSYVLIEVTT